MLVEKITRKFLHHIYTMILILFYYSQDDINAFVEGHLVALRLDPVTPSKQEMIDDILLVYDPYDTGLVAKKTDKKKVTTGISAIKDNIPYIETELNDIITKLNTITHTDKSILIENGLNEISSFYSGNQHDILENYKQLKHNLGLTTAYASLMPQVTSLCQYVNNLYAIKENKKSNVTFGVINVKNLIDPISEALLINFCKLQIENSKNLDLVPAYFPTHLLDLPTKNDEILAINEYFAKGFQGTVINLIDVKYLMDGYIEIDCRKCLGDVDVFLASDITNVVPLYARRIKKGERIIFKMSALGSSTQMYLMAAFAADATLTEECKFKVTIEKYKPRRKNVIIPDVATTIPVVETPVPTIVATTPTEEIS